MVRASSAWRVLLLLLSGFLFPRIATAAETSTKRLAVLEFVSSALKDETLKAFSDALRGGAVEALNGRAIAVMTRENMVMLLKSMGRSECSEGECEVETARNIGADYVISGSVTIIEGTFVVTLKLHETQNGNLLGTDVVESRTQIEILRSLREHGRDLVGGKLGRSRNTTPTGQERHIEASSDFAVGQVNQVVVKFDSTPPGAAVIVDGVLLCKETPCSRQLAPGTHDIEMQKEGYEPARTSLPAKKGAAINLSLNATFATLIVQTNPPDLPYLVNGRREEAHNGALLLAPGQYKILLDHSCYLPTGEQVVVRKGERRELRLTAQPREAGIDVSATDEAGNDIEGNVLVDGTELGKTPGAFKVPVCSREIVVTAPEGRYASALQLAEKQTTAIRAQVSAQTEPTAQRSPQTARMSPRGEQPEKSTPRPVELGLRVGLALPMGYYVGDQQLSDSIKRAIPVEFDVGTRATPAVYVGAYIQLGYGEAGDRLACSLNSTSDSCDDVTLLRTGLEVHYRWLLTKNSYLWTGTGTGFEMLSASQPRENLHTYGWDIAHLDVGLDYWTSDSVAIGPYASWSIAEYMKMKSSPASGDSTTVDVGNPTTHQWIMFGLRFVWVKTAS
jgi:TolB-like protein